MFFFLIHMMVLATEIAFRPFTLVRTEIDIDSETISEKDPLIMKVYSN